MEAVRLYAQLGDCGSLGLPCTEANQSTLLGIFNVAFILIGSLAVIFIIFGGIKYIASGGNPEQTNKAKNTILYAVIGLVVSVFSVAIINFVIARLL